MFYFGAFFLALLNIENKISCNIDSVFNGEIVARIQLT